MDSSSNYQDGSFGEDNPKEKKRKQFANTSKFTSFIRDDNFG